MTINDAMHKYRLPNPTTPEDLECRWSKVPGYGDKILLAGYCCQPGGPDYFGTMYERLDENRTCEGTIGLYAASDLVFEDDGHAIAWAIQQA